MNMKLDWFSLFKMEVMSLSASFQEVKKEVVVMIATNEWILEDIDLSRSFQNLQNIYTLWEMLKIKNLPHPPSGILFI